MKINAATIDRAQRLISLTHRLIDSPMDQIELASFLNFSPSAARKYARDLVDAGVAISSIEGTNTRRTFSIIDTEHAARWIARLIDPQTVMPPRVAKRAAATPPGLHLLADDTPWAPRRRLNAPVTRDPLVAALFGDGPAKRVVYDDSVECEIIAAQQEPEPPMPTAAAATPATIVDTNPWLALGGNIDWSAA